MAKFTGHEGRLISSLEIKSLTEPHHAKEKEIASRGENYIKAEFFGIHTFNKLIQSYGESCVGFRVYYGNREEDHNGDEPVIGKGKPTSRLIIVPVSADGKDITKGMGLKDMPNGDDDGMTGGPVCPNHC
ncbi:hypothetical protein [Dyadobacter sp. LHD-138]|uniref:hypothetical protein n=1 Tax=Dyadobacter sp. LHD-138 TaxID=3071413 RepID=UPI0027E14947|nr:hypothetical protein [Dyadobacter sp. LHD-138]MDQ6479650.1 hypothetical protein [Dyadobacter sp. LHD-138]